MTGVNLLGAAYGIQAFVPRMLTQGRPATIVNAASQAGLVPRADGPLLRLQARRSRNDRGAERRPVRARYPRQRGLPRRDRHPDRTDWRHAPPHAGNPGPGHRDLRQAGHPARNGPSLLASVRA